MNRIDQTFQTLKQEGRAAFIAYITAGDPDLSLTRDLVPALERAGADIIELGVPFSDPMADGPVIQAASQRALAAGTTLKGILRTVEEIRRVSQVPIALMTYYNPVLRFGDTDFVREAARSGVDGLIIPDLPPEEAGTLIHAARLQDVATIFFLAPTTDKTRIPVIRDASTGFIYYVSVAGVTGARQELPKDLLAAVARAKRAVNLPVCVGFGVSRPDQVKALAGAADGVIVGSALVRAMEGPTARPEKLTAVEAKVRELSAPLRRAG